MEQEEGLTAVDNIVTQFNTYEDFLDSQITTVDLYYLEVRTAGPQSGRVAFQSLGPFRFPASWVFRPLAVDVRPRSFPTAAAAAEVNFTPHPTRPALLQSVQGLVPSKHLAQKPARAHAREP